jgi:uncharacterized protein with HEPN domain
MSRKVKDRLKDILVETDIIQKIKIEVKNKKGLIENEFLTRTAERSIEIIGEAVKNIPKSIKKLSPNTPWKDIAGMRDRLAHDYHNTNHTLVWSVIETHAPSLKPEIVKILNHLNREKYLEYKTQQLDWICAGFPRIPLAQLTTEPPSESYLIRTKQLEELDIALAKTIIKEYPVKFQHVAIAEVKDIIGASDRALELSTNSENITCSEYVAKIVALSVSKSTEKQSNNLDR